MIKATPAILLAVAKPPHKQDRKYFFFSKNKNDKSVKNKNKFSLYEACRNIVAGNEAKKAKAHLALDEPINLLASK